MCLVPESPKKLTRRAAVGRLASLAAASLLTGCTPLRVVLADPRGSAGDRARRERVLCAFVAAVIPGAPEDDPLLARAHLDAAYPFARYAGYFVTDLCRRSRKLFGSPALDRLALEQRVAIVQDGLAADATTRRLYTGAIFLAQISLYAGIYDDRPGSRLIDFDGPYRIRDACELTYADARSFLPLALTRDGNPV